MLNTLATITQLPAAAGWDLVSFLKNAADYAKIAGGALVTLIGVVAVVWGAVLLVKKFMSEQSRDSWLKIIALMLIGGAIVASGAAIIWTVTSGGQQTIEDLGGGSILLSHAQLLLGRS